MSGGRGGRAARFLIWRSTAILRRWGHNPPQRQPWRGSGQPTPTFPPPPPLPPSLDLIVSFAPLHRFHSILSFDGTTKWEENLGWAENSTMAVSTYECPFGSQQIVRTSVVYISHICLDISIYNGAFTKR
jgi:hypothetical protein